MAELIKEYKDWIKNVETYKDKVLKQSWQRAKRFYLGKPRISKKLVVNIILPTLQSMIPQLYYENPYIFVKPQKELYFDQASLSESLINYQLRELKIKHEVEECVLDALMYGNGVIYTGWMFESEPQIAGEGFEADELVKKDEPFVKRISPWDFLIDIEASDLRSARIVGRKLIMDIDEVKKNPKFINTEKVNSENIDLNLEYSGREEVIEKKVKNKAKLYELWDKKYNKVIVLADGQDEPLYFDDNVYQMEGHPFSALTFYRNPDEFYTVSHVETLAHHQAELNELSNLLLKHVKTFVSKKILAPTGQTGDKATQEKLLSASNIIVEVPGDPSQWKEFPNVTMNFDFYQLLNQIKSNIREISGVDELQRGGQSRETATAASIRQNFQGMKIGYMSAKVEELFEDVCTKLLQLDQQFLDKEVAIRVAGEQGEYWETLTKEDIQGEFSIYIEAGAIIKTNKEMLRKQWIDLYNLMRNDPNIDPRPLVEQLLKAYDVKNPKDFFKQQAIPQEQPQQGAIPPQAGAVNPLGAGVLPRIMSNSPALAPQLLGTPKKAGGMQGNLFNTGM